MHTVNAVATLIEVTGTMVRTGDLAVPIVDHDQVVGIITTDDLLPALLGYTRELPK